MTMNQNSLALTIVRLQCERSLRRLEKLFQPHCRLTLLMRNPESDDGDLLLTRDDLVEVEDAIRKFREADDICEHGVKDGDYCEPCNRAYKDAAADPNNHL